MTDLIGNILTQMSSAFNQSQKTNKLKLQEDKTLKWRGLHHNQFASARKRSKNQNNDDGSDDDDEILIMSESVDDFEALIDQQDEIELKTESTILTNSNDDGNSSKKGNGNGNNDSIDSYKTTKEKQKQTNNNNKRRITRNYQQQSQSQSSERVLRKNTNKNGSTVENDDGTNSVDIKIENIGDRVSVVNETPIPPPPILSPSTPKKTNQRKRKIQENIEIPLIIPSPETPPPTQPSSSSSQIQTNNKRRHNNMNMNNNNKTKDLFSETNNEILNEDGTPPIPVTINKRGRKKRISLQSSSSPPLIQTSDNNNSNEIEIKTKMNVTMTTATLETETEPSLSLPIENNTTKVVSLDDEGISNDVSDMTSTTINTTVTVTEQSNKKRRGNKKDLNSSINIREETTNNVCDNNVDDDGITNEKLLVVVKKRGRKPKNKQENEEPSQPTQVNGTKKKLQKILPKEKTPSTELTSQSQENITQRLSGPPQQRLSRRIKPTAKILANDELRYGFELQNSARLHITHDGNGDTINNTTDSLNDNEIPIQNQQRSIVNKPCPDPIKFLNDIKQSKIGSNNRSPELNIKQLNKKQQKDLYKLKEKHLEQLGLMKTTRTLQQPSTSSSTAITPVPPSSPPSATTKTLSSSLTPQSNDDDVDKGKPNKQQSNKQQQQQQNRKNFKTKSQKLSLSETPIEDTNSQTQAIKKKRKLNPNSTLNQIDMEQQQFTIDIDNNDDDNDDDRVIVNNNNCLCAIKSNYYVSRNQDTETFCGAEDQIEDHVIGCNNQITDDLLNLLRPSHRVSYMILCNSHKKRLLSHNCCAGCGVFCSQVNIKSIKYKIIRILRGK